MAQRVSVDVVKETRVGFSTDVSSYARAVLKDNLPRSLKKYRSFRLELIFVDDAQMKHLNRHYRHKNKTTDVLSFAYWNEPDKSLSYCDLGQIIISVPVLKKQADEQNHAYRQELAVLFVHGLLHILGHDHETPSDLKKMLKKEQQFLGDNAGLISRNRSD